jgi:hypothetical protein
MCWLVPSPGEVSMKSMTFKEFTDLPDGVVFSYWQPCVAHGLYIRGRIIRRDNGEAFDYYEVPLLPDQSSPDAAFEFGLETSIRWGCYNFDQLYAVYNQADVDELVRLLTNRTKINELEEVHQAQEKTNV